VLLAYWGYASLTAYLTPSFDSPDLITDPFSRIPEHTDGARYYWRFAETEVYEAVDLPIDLVNRVLFGSRRRRKVA